MQNLNFKTDLKSRAYKFSLDIIALLGTFPNNQSSKVISNQLVRAATSIGANLTESRAASSRLEFKKFNEIALKSANETQYWLCLARDASLSSSAIINPLLNEAIEMAKMLASGVIKLKTR